ncbi:MAG: dienelactone hydrolase family protein [Pirellulaceae bacterium]
MMRFSLHAAVAVLLSWAAAPFAIAQPLSGTEPLTWEGDLAARMVDGCDRFLLRKIDESVDQRDQHWHRDFSSDEAYAKSIEPNRRRLRHILGVRDERVPFDDLELVATTEQPALVGQGKNYKIYAVRWPAIGDITGEGLLLVPEKQTLWNAVALPDADVTPEQLVGLVEGVPPESQYARRMAEMGCRVVVPALISRTMQRRGIEGRRGANLTNREFANRSAFELGRHIIGYELQKTLAVVDWFKRDQPGELVLVGGWGEGGMLSLYAAAIDQRIGAALVSGYFGSRQNIWQEPIDRNVFSLLEQFGDAELASMVAPRALGIEAAGGPEITLPSEGGAPGRLVTPPLAEVREEVERARQLISRIKLPNPAMSIINFTVSGDGRGPCFCDATLSFQGEPAQEQGPPRVLCDDFKTAEREARQIHEIDRHNQWLLRESAYTRKEFFKDLDTSSPERFQETIEPYRDHFHDEIIGRFDDKPLPFNARSRKTYDEQHWTGYEVVLDVFPDVFAYGILCLPKDLKPGDKRPVVVCQHGLEGRPQDVVTGDHRAYHDFASKLAERGFITFAPQNIYIGEDRFRTLQRKANPIKKSLFAIMVPQHRQIVAWLSTLPNVDPERIGFYGLSYGGKSAMRIPPLVDGYCLSICSADFNEWIWKNASTRATFSYVWTKEYEIFEFDLGNTFNYAEMAALIAPRPFMVERGHFDGVSSDEAVAYEFAKVKRLYAVDLGLGDRCQIEFFNGPHTINGKGTFDFLHEHLNWPKPQP